MGGMPANENCPADSLAHVKLCFDIAEKYNAEIDMHVDETDDPFYRTLEMVADETLARGWQNRVTAGHTCALAAYDDHYASYVIDKVKKAGVHIITNPVTNLMLQGRGDKQPIRRGITRVKELLAAGVNVSYGQDCVKDTFYPYGSGDMLQVANVVVHAAQMSLPDEIEKVYDMITYDANRILKLDGYGIEEGCRANLVIVNADDARDAIRLNPERLYVCLLYTSADLYPGLVDKLHESSVTNTFLYSFRHRGASCHDLGGYGETRCQYNAYTYGGEQNEYDA